MADGGSQSIHDEIEGTLSLLELPIALIDVKDLTIVAASSVLLKLLGLSGTEVVGRPVTDLYTPEDGAAATVALSAIRDGVVDFYRSERHLAPTFTSPTQVTAWGRSVMLGSQHFALVEVAAGSARTESPLTGYFGREPRVMALATAGPDWVISSMSSDIVDLLGLATEDFVGQNFLSLVAEADVPGLIAADRMVSQELSVAKSVQLRARDGAWRMFCCVLTELNVSRNRSFMLVPVEDVAGPAPASVPYVSTASTERVAELERHLWRIAAEVEASGVLQQVHHGPDLSSLRELGSLSAKQWEVVSRLLQGKRVKTIAAEMFLSESTVRNHLSAIFERFGVHSQAELLALLRDPDVLEHDAVVRPETQALASSDTPEPADSPERP